AVVEAGGRRIVTGPDGRFWMPAGFRAKLLQLPVRGRLTVADGLRFGVQPIRSRWWLLGLALGMILLGLAWARDPWSREKGRLAKLIQQISQGGMK
ncbi:MAG: hypothetical protein QN194_15460, partial [Armatimonadota bacterium]|nr:hypothetical protein [Armatimonadota bacterium]